MIPQAYPQDIYHFVIYVSHPSLLLDCCPVSFCVVLASSTLAYLTPSAWGYFHPSHDLYFLSNFLSPLSFFLFCFFSFACLFVSLRSRFRSEEMASTQASEHGQAKVHPFLRFPSCCSLLFFIHLHIQIRMCVCFVCVRTSKRIRAERTFPNERFPSCCSLLFFLYIYTYKSVCACVLCV